MKRTYVRLKLSMESKWRVGSWESQAADVVGVLTDEANKAVAPGSGIAGALRHAAGADREGLFGPAPGASRLATSPWWVLGTVVKGAEISQRQRTRIDRKRGSAAEKGLFRAEEVGPSGTEATAITVYLRREHESADAKTDIVDPLAAALRGWCPQVGGGKSVGLGRAEIGEVVHVTVDLDQSHDLLKLLNAAGGPVQRVDALLEKGTRLEAAEYQSRSTPYLTAEVKVDFLAVTSSFADRIDGSTWKGLLRSRVEFIGRSLGFEPCGADPQEEAVTVAGHPAGKQKRADGTGCGECEVCRVFGSSQRPGIWQFRDSPWTMQATHERQRIAIDRFTGGVRHGSLWPQQYVSDVSLALQIDGTAPQPGDDWVRLALLHALRDLDDGLVSVGPEGAAGYGRASVSQVKLAEEPVALNKLDPVPLPSGKEVA